MNKREIDSVLIAKGIAISLVVAGHYTPANSPGYWLEMRNVIYAFHMPVFFALAGYLYGYTPQPGYLDLLKKKFNRLVVPFLSVSVFFVVVKYIAGMRFSLLYPVNLESISFAFVYPIRSYVSPLWFIYALILIFILFPILFRILRRNLYFLFCTSLILYSIEWTEAFCLAQVFHHLPIFTLGYIVGCDKIDLDSLTTRKGALAGFFLSAAVFAGLYLLKFHFPVPSVPLKALTLFLYLSGSVACVFAAVALALSQTRFGNCLKSAGMYSMGIYLFHTAFASALRIGFNDVLHIADGLFLPAALVSVGAGILLPLLLEKYWLRSNRFTRRLILGLR